MSTLPTLPEPLPQELIFLRAKPLLWQMCWVTTEVLQVLVAKAVPRPNPSQNPRVGEKVESPAMRWLRVRVIQPMVINHNRKQKQPRCREQRLWQNQCC